MFEQVVNMVKEHLNNNPQVRQAVPPDQQDAVSHEVATQMTQGLAAQAPQHGGVGGLLDQLQGGLANNSPITGAISGGLVSALGSKFGLPPAATGAIAGALPGLLEKFANKAKDPNDHSITPEGLGGLFGNLGNLGGLGGKLGGLFGK
ncbi:hypothetical protein EPD60_12920 [Flaviaesturariibacter flavus]|uniref:DUF937 domain-containing protein n=1 Tax=Flaviaesturariibacter flavus TaxID=2502780 RepID=A0A4R1B982_9BACT|nr:hypothetical protein [Flaviaesturariibacter flavus]TCJ13289.1 hypothetical protein EPD60_12920 [Flaviaesturariibacter flavus]